MIFREMPAIFPDNTFPNLGRRLASIVEATETQISSIQEVLLKFEGHWLLVRRSAQGFLTILTAETVNFPALKMASNVALKQISEHLIASPRVAPGPAADLAEATPSVPVTETAPVAPAQTTEPPKKRRMWRGQWID
jgi:hypothetical protein